MRNESKTRPAPCGTYPAVVVGVASLVVDLIAFLFPLGDDTPWLTVGLDVDLLSDFKLFHLLPFKKWLSKF